MIRKKAIIYLCSLAIATAAFSAGCTRLSEGSENSDVSFEANAENLEEGSVAKAENCVKNFINAINTQNFDGIADMIYLPENAFVSDKNVEWYLQRSGVSDITGVKIKNFDVEISDGALTKDATVYINKSGYQLSLAMDADNQWKIVMNDMFVENWSLKVPKGCTITVDGVDVDQYKIQATAIDVYDTYTFPAIAKQSVQVDTKSSLFGSFTQTITPSADSETVPLICKINDAETTNILRQIQNVWNALYTDYTNGVDIESVKKYFTDDFDNSVITDIMFNYFQALEKPAESEDQVSYSNFYMKEAIPWTTNNYGCAILNTSDSVLVNFGYRLDFTSTNGGSYTLKKISQITMAYDSAESTYKIKQVNDPKLFYNNDYTLNDY